MPYRRLPKTDAARLTALKTLLDNNDIYTARNKFIDWKLINSAQPLYDRLLTATEQYKISMAAQVRKAKKMDGLQRRAFMYLSHFIQVLLMSAERGEVKRKQLPLYGIEETATAMPNIKSAENLLDWGPKIIEGEKERLKKVDAPFTIRLLAWFLPILTFIMRLLRLKSGCKNAPIRTIMRFRSCAPKLMHSF